MSELAQILFTQVHGSVDQETSNDPNGVEVTLSLWTAPEGDWRLPNHYLLKKIVMVDRHYEMDEVEVHVNSIYGQGPALEIRNAIAVFDALKSDLTNKMQSAQENASKKWLEELSQ
jgi:hypothetical protein